MGKNDEKKIQVLPWQFGNPYELTAHLSQLFPSIFGLHVQCPAESHISFADPYTLQLQPLD